MVVAIDPASGQTRPTEHAAISTRQIAADGRRILVQDHSRSGTLRTTCGFAGCQTGYPVTRASDLVVTDRMGGSPVVLAQGGYDRDPAWSSDGTTILYISHRRDERGADFDLLMLATPGGEELGTLTAAGLNDIAATWSPDGTSVAVIRHAREQAAKDWQLHIISLLTGETSVLATGPFLQIAWSPDGRWIAAVKQRLRFDPLYPNGFPVAEDLWLVAADGSGEQRQLTNFVPDLGLSGGSIVFCAGSGGYIPKVSSPVWSRDGQLAFLTNHKHLERFGRRYDVALADLAGGEPVVVFDATPDRCEGDPAVYGSAETIQGERIDLLGWN